MEGYQRVSARAVITRELRDVITKDNEMTDGQKSAALCAVDLGLSVINTIHEIGDQLERIATSLETLASLEGEKRDRERLMQGLPPPSG